MERFNETSTTIAQLEKKSVKKKLNLISKKICFGKHIKQITFF